MRQPALVSWLQVALVTVFLAVTAASPHDGFTWLLEVSWVLLGLVALAVLRWRRIPISWLLAWALFLHALILIYGGWYTYERVPLGHWCAELCGWQRNHYDRLGHFAQGFFPAILLREVLIRRRVVNGRAWREFLVFCGMMASTALFELLEFAAAQAFGADADAYLGSQGDVWDAQRDMLMCGLGALVSIAALARLHERLLARAGPAAP